MALILDVLSGSLWENSNKKDNIRNLIEKYILDINVLFVWIMMEEEKDGHLF